MKVVVDTNLVVSRALVSRGIPAQILAAWRGQAFELLVSSPSWPSINADLGYTRLRAKHLWDDAQIAETIAEFREFATLVTPTRPIAAVADDPDDDKFLECAVEGGADVIVSGDPHLLRLRVFEGIPISSPADFFAFLQQQADEDD